MFIPLFIAMLLGFVHPSITASKSDAATTINATNANDEDPGDDTGGEHGHLPPPK